MPPTSTSTTTLLPPEAKPPKSKSQPYYSVHPSWQDVVPIAQVDQAGALAAIAYSPRYSEAMSYLRSVMADTEVSERALALTEDLISMNPAHYTVWIYRMRVLRGMWTGAKAAKVDEADEKQEAGDEAGEIDEALWQNIQRELKWLDEVSFRNLKNYQIWHHRHALVDLLPSTPDTTAFTASTPSQSTETTTSDRHKKASTAAPLTEATKTRLLKLVASEQTFLAQILSLDTKNYHVWSYRQWLCMRFPSFLLPSYTSETPSSVAGTYRSHPEVAAIDAMILDDLRNNSAWSHRYFILFGHHELTYSNIHGVILKNVNEERLLHKAGLVDMPLIEAEIEYTKQEIRKAPMNGSSWNYLRGLLSHSALDISTTRDFCEEFLGPEKDLWMDQYVDVESEDSETGEKQTERQQIGVRSSHAVEWLSEIYAAEGTEEGRRRAKECLRSLGEKWDIIRMGYWDFLGEKMEEEWKQKDA
ncbi:CAAX geranylgeranyltransferase alpha subunit [Neophaeococcomyces mojaviensis]|uniref:CAAX geranylgeranyltransferase alpha subunit n=1 Tax=Neophaeococcomyces mojaviensis TaxID=3383035 RepID=A0ACC3A4E5_9EURO|nr:CAAX geranylgeranyltransferase alpha subunit [Knufia sp. JES_112]